MLNNSSIDKMILPSKKSLFAYNLPEDLVDLNI